MPGARWSVCIRADERLEVRNDMEKDHGCTETQKVEKQNTHAACRAQDGPTGVNFVPQLRAGKAASQSLPLMRVL